MARKWVKIARITRITKTTKTVMIIEVPPNIALYLGGLLKHSETIPIPKGWKVKRF